MSRWNPRSTPLPRSVARDATYAGLLDNTEDGIVALDAESHVTVWNKGAERMYGWTADEVIGRDVSTVAPLALSDEQRIQQRRVTAEHGRWHGELVAARKDGGTVHVEVIAVPIHDDAGHRTGLLGIHRDVTARRLAEAEHASAARQQALVAELGQRALAGNGVQSVMDQAVDVVARAFDLDLVGIAEILPGEGELVPRAGVGWRPGAVGHETGGAGRASLVGFTVVAGEPVVSEDVGADERFDLSDLVAEAPASAATVLIAGREAPFGVLGAFSRERRSFSADDVNFLQAVANVISTAVERLRSERRLIEVRDAERRRIARDLHDDALQDLADALAQASATGDDDMADRLARLAPALKRVNLHLLGAIYDLRLGGEEQRAFPELLEELVGLQRAIAVDCRIEVVFGDGAPTDSLGVPGIEVLRVIAEALINARRHSGAQNVRVDVSAPGERLLVEVADDGRGFDQAGEPPGTGGAGITGMNERAGLLGADLEIVSAPGAGTRVRLALPFNGARDGADDDVRVLLVEDHAALRDGMAALFDREPGFRVTGQAASMQEARGLLVDVDVALIDLGLPDGYGGDLIAELRDVNPQAQALVLTATLDREAIASAVETGAAGVLNKTVHLDEVVGAVRRLRAGETLLSLDEVIDLLSFAKRRRETDRIERNALDGLTPREHEVLQALAEGLDSQGIADRLHITVRTERNHVANILVKLGVHSQLQALVVALRHDIVDVRKPDAPPESAPSP